MFFSYKGSVYLCILNFQPKLQSSGISLEQCLAMISSRFMRSYFSCSEVGFAINLPFFLKISWGWKCLHGTKISNYLSVHSAMLTPSCWRLIAETWSIVIEIGCPDFSS